MEHKKFMFIHRLAGYVTEIVVFASGRGLLDIWPIIFRVCPNCKAADNQNSLLFQLRRLENQLFYDVGYGLRDRTGLSMIPTRSIAPKDKFVFRPSSNRQNSLKARVHQSFLYSTKMIIICVQGLKLFQNLVN